jgi:outer membrane protein TolC
VREKQEHTVSARANYFPQLSHDSRMLGLSDKQLVTVPAGSLGTIPGLGPFPLQTMAFDQGSSTVVLANTTLGQPLTQLLKIREGVRIASSDQRISEAELKKAEDEVVLGVHQLYFGLLAARKQIGSVRAQIAADQEKLREARDAVRTGNLLEVAVLGARASLLRDKQALLAAENQVSDLTAELDNLLGLPLDTELELADSDLEPGKRLAREEYLKSALEANPEVRAARETIAKARSAVAAARYEYIPNLGAFARQTYQTGVPFVTHNFGSFGLQMTWDIFDWGKRKGVVGERQAQLMQAEANLRRISDRVAVDVEKAYRKLERTEMMVDVAREALALRRESERISGQQLKAGVVSEAKTAEAVAATRGAEVDDLQARLAYQLALAEMARLSGK